MGRKAPSRVRIPPSPLAPPAAARLSAAAQAPVAQLDRASVYGTEGQRFESSRARYEPAGNGGFSHSRIRNELVTKSQKGPEVCIRVGRVFDRWAYEVVMVPISGHVYLFEGKRR